MKKLTMKKVIMYTVFGISAVFIGILIIPLGILFLLIYITWNGANSFLHLLDRALK